MSTTLPFVLPVTLLPFGLLEIVIVSGNIPDFIVLSKVWKSVQTSFSFLLLLEEVNISKKLLEHSKVGSGLGKWWVPGPTPYLTMGKLRLEAPPVHRGEKLWRERFSQFGENNDHQPLIIADPKGIKGEGLGNKGKEPGRERDYEAENRSVAGVPRDDSAVVTLLLLAVNPLDVVWLPLGSIAVGSCSSGISLLGFPVCGKEKESGVSRVCFLLGGHGGSPGMGSNEGGSGNLEHMCAREGFLSFGRLGRGQAREAMIQEKSSGRSVLSRLNLLAHSSVMRWRIGSMRTSSWISLDENEVDMSVM
ncbi:hypothetical protein J437_LFUL010933 [Ladona fulva]|uniref:Uncharacterized protein n=1 Tax=Ladona fulva TaxID=123851 RepID=A0A8K0KBA6_LADFU|nr:hypothetical protein J437_LFUL010933 [Ladona fulva]